MTDPEAARPAVEPVWRQAALALPRLVKLISLLLADGRVPVRYRLLALAALGYVVSPIDVVPDVVPLLGQTDDVLIVALALRLLLRGAGKELVAEYWDGTEDVLEMVDGVLEWAGNLVPRPFRFAVERWASR